MSKLATVAKWTPVVLIILALAGTTYYEYREAKTYQAMLAQKNEELQQSNLALGRAHSELVDQKKLHETAMAEMDKKLQDEIKKRKALITLYAELQAKYDAAVRNIDTLTRTVEELSNATSIADLPPGKLFYKREDGKFAEVKKLGWSFKDFRIDIDGEAEADGFNADQTIHIKHILNYKLHQKFKVKFIETQLPAGGRNHYAELYELNEKGEAVGKLELTEFEVLMSDKLPMRNMWWNPKLDLQAGGSISTKLRGHFTADLGLSISSRGTTKDDITWRFFRVGVGLTGENVSLSFSPVQYNLGKNLPLVSNVWITPYAGYSFGDMVFIFGAGVGVVF